MAPLDLDGARWTALFPGVGTQHTGMGLSWYSRHAIARATFEEASDHAGLDLAALCHDRDQAARLNDPLHASLAAMTHGVALFRVLRERLPPPTDLVGHSLGELTALVCGRSLSLAAGLTLVRQRAQIIAEVAASLDGTMAWVVNLRAELVERLCRSLRLRGVEVHVAGFDAPTQVAIAGARAAVEAAADRLERCGAIIYPLRLPGPYHSPLMAAAAQRFAALLTTIELRRPSATVLANVDASAHEGGQASADKLARQLASPVRWLDCVRALEARGAGPAIELGPKATLGFLLGKSHTPLRAWALERYDDLDALLGALDPAALEPEELRSRCLSAALCLRTRARGDREAILARGRALERLARTESSAAELLAETAALLRAKGLDEAAIALRLDAIVDGRLRPEVRP